VGPPMPARALASDAELLRVAGTHASLQPRAAAHLTDLQRAVGNQHVLHVLRSLPGAEPGRRSRRGGFPIQRYAVNQPASAGAEALVNWLNTSSPHQPAWAKTTANFSWKRQMSAEPVEDEEGRYRVTVADSTVTHTNAVDMPTWTAARPPMQASWDAMWSELRAHEAEHEAIGTGWKTTLEERLAAAEYVVSASSVAGAKAAGLALADADWATWIAEHQADQTALDTPPFFATLMEPAEEDEGAEEGESD